MSEISSPEEKSKAKNKFQLKLKKTQFELKLPFYIDEKLRNQILKYRPMMTVMSSDTKPVFHPHPLLASQREIALGYVRQSICGYNRGVWVDVGGNPGHWFVGDEMSKTVWVLQPVIDPQDVVRQRKQRPTDQKCAHKFQDNCKCWKVLETKEATFKGFVFIHSLYYLQPEEIYSVLKDNNAMGYAVVHNFPGVTGSLAGEAVYLKEAGRVRMTMNLGGSYYEHSDLSWMNEGSERYFPDGSLVWNLLTVFGNTFVYEIYYTPISKAPDKSMTLDKALASNLYGPVDPVALTNAIGSVVPFIDKGHAEGLKPFLSITSLGMDITFTTQENITFTVPKDFIGNLKLYCVGRPRTPENWRLLVMQAKNLIQVYKMPGEMAAAAIVPSCAIAFVSAIEQEISLLNRIASMPIKEHAQSLYFKTTIHGWRLYSVVAGGFCATYFVWRIYKMIRGTQSQMNLVGIVRTLWTNFQQSLPTAAVVEQHIDAGFISAYQAYQYLRTLAPFSLFPRPAVVWDRILVATRVGRLFDNFEELKLSAVLLMAGFAQRLGRMRAWFQTVSMPSLEVPPPVMSLVRDKVIAVVVSPIIEECLKRIPMVTTLLVSVENALFMVATLHQRLRQNNVVSSPIELAADLLYRLACGRTIPTILHYVCASLPLKYGIALHAVWNALNSDLMALTRLDLLVLLIAAALAFYWLAKRRKEKEVEVFITRYNEERKGSEMSLGNHYANVAFPSTTVNKFSLVKPKTKLILTLGKNIDRDRAGPLKLVFGAPQFPPVMHSSNQMNEALAMANRLSNPEPIPIDETSPYFKLFALFKTHFVLDKIVDFGPDDAMRIPIKSMGAMHFHDMFRAWNTKWPPKRREENLKTLETMNLFDMSAAPAGSSCFVKVEKLMLATPDEFKDKDPRAICPQSRQFTCLFGPVFHFQTTFQMMLWNLDRAWARSRIYPAFATTNYRLGVRFFDQELVGKHPCYYYWDFSRMDCHHQEPIMKLDLELLKTLKLPETWLEFYVRAAHAWITSKNGVKVKANAQTRSGQADTSYSNTWTNAAIWAVTVAYSCGPGDVFPRCAVIGDDGASSGDVEIVKRCAKFHPFVAKKMGYKLTTTVCMFPWELSFCSGLFWPIDPTFYDTYTCTYLFGFMPGRFFAKFGWNIADSQDQALRNVFDALISNKNLMTHVPVVSQMRKRVLRLLYPRLKNKVNQARGEFKSDDQIYQIERDQAGQIKALVFFDQRYLVYDKFDDPTEWRKDQIMIKGNLFLDDDVAAPSEPSDEAYSHFVLRYGVPMMEVTELICQIEKIEELPVLLSHPVITKCIRVDAIK